MEIGKSQLARLVLGYLKNENCTKAFNEFLTTSRYLTQHALFVKNGKYFATRVAGQTLEDIINEYTEISLIIQGKLEQTSYYEEHHKMNLVEQLKYILDYDSGPSPILPEVLNTTPSESLPGNSSPKNTPKNSNNPVKPTFGECSPIECMGNISQILSQTLLEKPELHEKLADAINSVRKSSERQDVELESASNQLDNKIKTIIQKAEEDPIFEQILGEIIGNKSDVPVPSTSKYIPSSNTQSLTESTPKSDDTTKKKFVDKSPPFEERSIEPTRKPISTDVTSMPPVSNSGHLSASAPNSNSEVIIFNGNLDSYVGKTGPPMVPPQHSQIYVTNTSGVLMLPPMITTPNYFFVNSQSNQVSSVLTDSDIMKMPTVILDEGPTKSQVKESASHPQSVRRCKALLPKSDNITVSTSCGNYLAVYKDDGEVVINNSGGEEAPPTSKATTKSNPRPVLRKKLHRQAKMKKVETVPDEEKRKSPFTPTVKTEAKKSTPKSPSHVRTLDFATPTKCAAESKTEDNCNAKKIDTVRRGASKNLFKSVKKSPGKNEKRSRAAAWDSELRDLLIPRDVTLDSPDTSNENVDACEDDVELRNEVMLIEAAFKTPLKKTVENENVAASDIRDDTPAKEIPVKEDVTEVEMCKKESSVEAVTVTETQVYLRNCNAPPRFKKKCNVSQNIVQTCEVEVVIEKDETIETQVNKPEETVETPQNCAQLKKNMILETPVKDLLKTPGTCELTPFSKELEEQIRGMDLLSMPTPNLPLTPSFPITPCINLDTPVHFNRPTDYSTSSSYYQPSDSEQNKSLEVMIEECKKLENRSEQANEMTTEENRGENEKNSATSADEIKRMFNQNVIGKKNLSLMHQTSSSSCSSDDSNSSYSTSSSSSNSDSEYDPSHGQNVVVRKETYCLRRRKVTPKAEEKSTKPPPVPPKATNKIKSVIEEIIDKRERVLKLLKSEDMNGAKTTPRNVQSKEKACKTIKKPASRRKSRSPIKKPLSRTNEQISKLCDVENEITDDDFALHLSTDEDTTNKPGVEGAQAKDKEETAAKVCTQVEKPSPSSDLEAEQLVQGLKERGIHLVHKKSPNKDTSLADVTERKAVDAGADQIHSVHDAGPKKETSPAISQIEEQEQTENDIPTSANTSSLNVSSNDLDVTFDIQLFEEDRQLTVDFNSGKKKPKRTAYDSKMLEKEMKANVYIESLDMEMERIIKCSPFDLLLDIASKNAASKAKKKSAKRDRSPFCLPNNTQEKIEKKQNICDIKKISRDRVKSAERKACNSMKSDQSDKQKNSHKSKTTKRGENESEKCLKRETKDLETKIENFVNSDSTFKVKTGVNRIAEEDLSSNKETLLNIQWGKSPVLKKEDDELMNYAIMGSQREENPESPKSGNKRKYSSSEDGEPMEKKCKTEQQQALLKKIDVDMFLNRVHGNAGKS